MRGTNARKLLVQPRPIKGANYPKTFVVVYFYRFSIDFYKFLEPGGRIPSSVATIGGFLNIKPTLTFKSGKLEMLGKCRGFKAAVKQAVSKICSSDIDTQYPITVAHANNLEACLDFINQLNEKIPSLKIETSEVGPAIGSHSGEWALAIFYQTK